MLITQHGIDSLPRRQRWDYNVPDNISLGKAPIDYADASIDIVRFDETLHTDPVTGTVDIISFNESMRRDRLGGDIEIEQFRKPNLGDSLNGSIEIESFTIEPET